MLHQKQAQKRAMRIEMRQGLKCLEWPHCSENIFLPVATPSAKHTLRKQDKAAPHH
jgi:hypothetical protein